MAATGINQLLEVLKALSGEIANLQSLTDPLYDLVKCVSVLKDCFGLLNMLGIAIGQAMPTIQDQIPSLVKLLAGSILSNLEAAAVKMEAGDATAIKAMCGVLGTAGTISGLQPANIKNMIKLAADALNAILDQVEKCT
ncbi:hypothetical protein BG003_006460 [Podila horticola]|nr:hypothetical protein BG003_006460 [Podila horticola]